jgi:hypothetical protein
MYSNWLIRLKSAMTIGFCKAHAIEKFLKIYLNYDFLMWKAYSKHAFHKPFMNSMEKPNK